MALIDAPIDADNPIYVGFRANSAAKMAQLLTQWLADNGGQSVMDIEISATGAAPNFFCTLVAGDPGTTESVLASQAVVVAVGGVGQVDTAAMIAEVQAAVRALAPVPFVYKIVSAGGGAGPHWMAVALAGGSPE